MAGYIPRWYTYRKTVTHPSTNRAQHALTSFIRRTPQIAKFHYTDSTGPARTRMTRISEKLRWSVRVSDKVRAGPRGSGRAPVVEFSLNHYATPSTGSNSSLGSRKSVPKWHLDRWPSDNSVQSSKSGKQRDGFWVDLVVRAAVCTAQHRRS